MIHRRRFLTASGTAALAAVAASRIPFGWPRAAASSHLAPTCELALANRSISGTVNAYVTGHEGGTGRWMLLRADGSYYHLEEPGAPQTPLPVDCAIPLNPAGAGPVVLELRQMYGSRIYFVHDDTLDFFVNPGPALVEPACATPADPNYSKVWSFCEFTFNEYQIFVNLSFVDLITALPIGLRLVGDGEHDVAAADRDAVEAVAADLEAQAADGQPWNDLVIRENGRALRAFAPQGLIASDGSKFAGFWEGYADEAWEKYRGTDLRIDLQGGRPVLTGRVQGDTLTFEGGHTFAKPTTADIFSCNSGPFANNPGDSDEKKGLLARLAAAFNRSTLHSHADQPSGAPIEDFYRHPVTNHWSRIIHANTPIGYGFPYDDVRGDDHPDVSGAAHDPNPQRLTVSIG